jgi:hypothetical protein
VLLLILVSTNTDSIELKMPRVIHLWQTNSKKLYTINKYVEKES